MTSPQHAPPEHTDLQRVPCYPEFTGDGAHSIVTTAESTARHSTSTGGVR